MTPSHLTMSDLEGQSQGHSNLEALYLVKEQSWPYVTIKHKYESICVESTDAITFDFSEL